jgi:hypothetical protein
MSARYDVVMLLSVWVRAYLRGVLARRRAEDRCRYDATFRQAPDGGHKESSFCAMVINIKSPAPDWVG